MCDAVSEGQEPTLGILVAGGLGLSMDFAEQAKCQYSFDDHHALASLSPLLLSRLGASLH